MYGTTRLRPSTPFPEWPNPQKRFENGFQYRAAPKSPFSFLGVAKLSALAENLTEAELVVVLGETRSRFALYKPVVTIGRRPDRDIILPEPHVSRTHAQIERHASDYIIVDLGATGRL